MESAASSSPRQGPHPLASRLIAAIAAGRVRGPVLEIAAGSGRNTRALVDAGIPVLSTRDADPITQLPGGRDSYGAALSTHGYLHGQTAKLRLGIAELRRVLQPGAALFLTLGSVRDARYGFGVPLDERTFAPGEGDEAGVPHAYFDRDGVIELLVPAFEIVSLDEIEVDATVGRWAHPGAGTEDDVGGRVHWFVEARRRP